MPRHKSGRERSEYHLHLGQGPGCLRRGSAYHLRLAFDQLAAKRTRHCHTGDCVCDWPILPKKVLFPKLLKLSLARAHNVDARNLAMTGSEAWLSGRNVPQAEAFANW